MRSLNIEIMSLLTIDCDPNRRAAVTAMVTLLITHVPWKLTVLNFQDNGHVSQASLEQAVVRSVAGHIVSPRYTFLRKKRGMNTVSSLGV